MTVSGDRDGITTEPSRASPRVPAPAPGPRPESFAPLLRIDRAGPAERIGATPL